MDSPCPKCGATKIAPLRYGFLRSTFKMFHYRLAECARCGRWRAYSSDKKTEEKNFLENACPSCGSNDYRRSRRTFWENLICRPPMVRCRKCSHRFPQSAKEPTAA